MDKVSTNSTRAKYLSYIDQHFFLNEVNRLRQDRYTKKLSALKFVKLMMVAQIQQTPTLTDISANLSADEHLQRDMCVFRPNQPPNPVSTRPVIPVIPRHRVR